MASDTAHVAERIDRPVAEVYAYVSDPAHLPEWAAGLGGGVEQVDGQWYVEAPFGRARVTFTPANGLGVLDHEVVTDAGDNFLNPLRVVPYGEGSEIVFSVRRAPDASDEDFVRDTDAVAADLARLKGILEGR